MNEIRFKIVLTDEEMDAIALFHSFEAGKGQTKKQFVKEKIRSSVRDNALSPLYQNIERDAEAAKEAQKAVLRTAYDAKITLE